MEVLGRWWAGGQEGRQAGSRGSRPGVDRCQVHALGSVPLYLGSPKPQGPRAPEHLCTCAAGPHLRILTRPQVTACVAQWTGTTRGLINEASPQSDVDVLVPAGRLDRGPFSGDDGLGYSRSAVSSDPFAAAGFASPGQGAGDAGDWPQSCRPRRPSVNGSAWASRCRSVGASVCRGGVVCTWYYTRYFWHASRNYGTYFVPNFATRLQSPLESSSHP